MDVNMSKKDIEKKNKVEAYVENGIRDLWIGLYDLWAEYKMYREFPSKLAEIR